MVEAKAKQNKTLYVLGTNGHVEIMLEILSENVAAISYLLNGNTIFQKHTNRKLVKIMVIIVAYE